LYPGVESGKTQWIYGVKTAAFNPNPEGRSKWFDDLLLVPSADFGAAAPVI
jgi:hypothetical protein